MNMKENRTRDDFSEEELGKMEQDDPDRFDQINQNTLDDMNEMMFPNGPTDPDGEY